LDWKTLAALLGVFVGGGSVTTVVLAHLLRNRQRTREETAALYAGLLDEISRAVARSLRETRIRPQEKPRGEAGLREMFQDRLEEVCGLERLSHLPEGFHRLPPLCGGIFFRYASCISAVEERRRRGEDASAGAQMAQELEEMAEDLERVLASASSRIRSLGAWSHQRMLEKLAKDAELTRCGLRILDLEESLETLFYETALQGRETGAGSRVSPLVEEHERLRAGGINLVASENRLSAAVRQALSCDLAGRYGAEGYGGSLWARRIVEAVEELAREVFRAPHALVSPLSGNLCVLAVLLAFSSPGDPVAMLPFSSGGYPLGLEKFQRRRVDIPADPRELTIDAPAAARTIAASGARLVFLGASFIPFPHPVREIAAGLEELGHRCLIAYDASHVLGLVACGEFQDPLREGAHILLGSTHKSLFGPQGGIILTGDAGLAASLRKMLELDLEEGIGLVDNPHLHRIAALGLALEKLAGDPSYGRRVVENARALAAALHEKGVPVRFADRGYTLSHQVLLDLGEEEARRLCRALEGHGIFMDAWGRLGTAEVTHAGMGRAEMEDIAEWISGVYHERPVPDLRRKVRELATLFPCR